MKAEIRLVILDKDAAKADEFYLMVAKPGGTFRGARLEYRESYYDSWKEIPFVEPYSRKNV